MRGHDIQASPGGSGQQPSLGPSGNPGLPLSVVLKLPASCSSLHTQVAAVVLINMVNNIPPPPVSENCY